MAQSSLKTCAECGQAATVFVSFVKGGKVTSAAWCATHAENARVFDPRSYALLQTEERAGRHRGENVARCPVCDCSQRDFERHGRFGCQACYGAFAGLLPLLLKRMHRSAEHRGKIPLRGADSAVMRKRLALLEAQLSDAVRNERFEWAAQTRDAIAAITARLLVPAPLLDMGTTPMPRLRTQDSGAATTPTSTPGA